MGMKNESLTAEPTRLVIRPTRGLAALNLGDLWVYRELVYFMTWRNLKVRYKQTLLGAAWVILQPALQVVVFTLLFNRLAKLDSDGVPYPIFSFAALLPWNLFAYALTDGGRSLVYNRNMLTKVYFPRLIIPVASVLARLVDFGVAFVVLLGVMAVYHFSPTGNYDFKFSWALLTLPLFLLLALVTALGVSLWLAALNVIYRDVEHLLPFLTQIWMFVSPVIYASRVISPKWQVLYALNPMVGVVDGFRWALVGTATAPGLMVWASAGVAVLVLVSGLFYFRRMERTFADEI
jgi:lipopolysaccharide transport system permease protein